MINFKLNVWDAIEIEDTKFDVTWATNDPKFQGRVTLSVEDSRIFRQLLLDRCIDQAAWQLLKTGDISCLKSHQAGNRTRVKNDRIN